jgi:hypothetical protein
VAERKAEMSSTSPEPDAQTTPVAGNDDSAEKYGDMNGNAEGFEAESPQAKQAKAEALAHARAARAARAKYARMVSQQAGAPNSPNNKMQAESFGDMVAAQGNRIGGVELSFIASRLVDQINRSLIEVRQRDPAVNEGWSHPAVKAALSGLVAWAPLGLLRPGKRGHGVRGIVSNPRTLSFGAATLIGLVEVIDTNARIKRDEDKAEEKALARALRKPSQKPEDRVPEKASDGDPDKVTSSRRSTK